MMEIVILGGGFAGVRAGLILQKRIQKSDDIHVTLIDKNSFHLFTPSLYEVAASEEPQRNVTIPLSAIFNSSISLIKGDVQRIDTAKQKILLSGKREFSYDYLIFALGSQSFDFDIPGVKEYGIALKTLEDALRIKSFLKKGKKVIVGGGGFSGTELACELVTHWDKNLNITIIQRSAVLLKELGGEISRLAKKRLEKGGVRLVFGEHIKKVTKETAETEKASYPCDTFIWTGGVAANTLLGKIETDEALRLRNFKNVFAAGDAVSPGVVRMAEKMGETAAKNVLRLIKGEPLIKYQYKDSLYLVPLGSHFAAFSFGKFHISGFLAYIIQQLIFLYYLLRILPPISALKRFRRFERDLVTHTL